MDPSLGSYPPSALMPSRPDRVPLLKPLPSRSPNPFSTAGGTFLRLSVPPRVLQHGRGNVWGPFRASPRAHSLYFFDLSA